VPPATRDTLVKLKDEVGPAGETVADRPTEPAKPFRLVRETVEVSEEPCGMAMEDGAALIVKSAGGVTVTVTDAV
jgi:hypothetical protein